MRASRNFLIGMIVILIGISIFLNTLSFQFNIAEILFPLIFLAVGVHFFQRGNRIIGGTFAVLSIVILFNNLFGINIFGIAFAAGMIYIGYRLIRGKKSEIDFDAEPKQKKQDPTDVMNDYKTFKEVEDDFSSRSKATSVNYKSSLLGDMHLMNHRFELHDMNVWHGIGDVKIDLSRAIVPEGETTIMIEGWIGDIDLYVPYGLEVSVKANVTLGDLDVLGHKFGGLNRSIAISTNEFNTSSRRIKILLSLFIGDIDVRYL